MEIRKLEPADAERLAAFLREMPEDDRTFFKEDVTDPETVRAMLTEPRGLSLVAIDGDKERKGKKLRPVEVEEDLYWGVMKYWYPDLELAGKK